MSSVPTPQIEAPTIIIRPSSGWIGLKLHELWEYRELLYFLVWRDLKVRYKQTALGAAWAVIQPFFSMVVFSLFFGRLAKMPSDGIPYPIFAYTGLVPWTFFARGLTQSSNSLVDSANLIRKVYFPRLTIPISDVLSGLVDFGIAFAVLIGMMLYYGVVPSSRIVWLPAFLLLALVSALAVGLWLSVLNVEYRDVKYTVPFLTQFWMFATPIVYPLSMIPPKWQALYSINPMVGIIEGFRWSLLGTGMPNLVSIGISLSIIVVALIGGAIYFRKAERSFADVI